MQIAAMPRLALAARKANKPAGSAMAMAQAMGIALLTQTQYRQLQELGPGAAGPVRVDFVEGALAHRR